MGNLKFDKKELEKLQKQLEELEKGKARDKFFEDCAKEMAARLLSLVVHKTPEGVYPNDSSRKGGNLRRGWTGGKKMDAEAFAKRVWKLRKAERHIQLRLRTMLSMRLMLSTDTGRHPVVMFRQSVKG